MIVFVAGFIFVMLFIDVILIALCRIWLTDSVSVMQSDALDDRNSITDKGCDTAVCLLWIEAKFGK